MLRRSLLIGMAALLFVSLPALAELPVDTMPQAETAGCSSELVDLTEPELASQLVGRELLPFGEPTIQYVDSSKVSSGIFSYIDENGEEQFVERTCTLTCRTLATGGCSQSGCEPHGSGCSSWNCGLTCTGYCNQRVEEIDIIIETEN